MEKAAEWSVYIWIFAVVAPFIWAVLLVLCAYTAQKWAYKTWKEVRSIRETIEWKMDNDAAAMDKGP